MNYPHLTPVVAYGFKFSWCIRQLLESSYLFRTLRLFNKINIQVTREWLIFKLTIIYLLRCLISGQSICVEFANIRLIIKNLYEYNKLFMCLSIFILYILNTSHACENNLKSVTLCFYLENRKIYLEKVELASMFVTDSVQMADPRWTSSREEFDEK